MKKLFFAVVLFFIVVSSFSQSYRPMLGNSGDTVNVWVSATFLLPFSGHPYVYVIQSDTSIMSNNYRIVDLCDLYDTTFSFQTYMREDSALKKVYIFDQGSSLDVLLYDFSLQINDSIFLDMDYQNSYSFINQTHAYDKNTCYSSGYFKVVEDFEISAVSDTSHYRVLYLESQNKISLNSVDSVNQFLIWIEGIGSLWAFDYRNGVTIGCYSNVFGINNFSFIPDCGGSSPTKPNSHFVLSTKNINGNCVFICDSITDQFMGQSTYCGMTLTDVQNTLSVDIHVNPNPATTSLTIEADFLVAQYRIFDTFGRIVLIGEVQDKKIDVSRLIPGLYFLQLDSDGKSFNARFVKE